MRARRDIKYDKRKYKMNYQGNEALRADVAQLANTMFELRERLRALESTCFGTVGNYHNVWPDRLSAR